MRMYQKMTINNEIQEVSNIQIAGMDPGFQKRGFICIKVWGFRFADFISIFLNIPCK